MKKRAVYYKNEMDPTNTFRSVALPNFAARGTYSNHCALSN